MVDWSQVFELVAKLANFIVTTSRGVVDVVELCVWHGEELGYCNSSVALVSQRVKERSFRYPAVSLCK